MMPARLLFLVLSLGVSASLSAQDADAGRRPLDDAWNGRAVQARPLPTETEIAAAVLREADANDPLADQAYLLIAAHPQAGEYYARIFEQAAHVRGKVYALAGLYRSRPAAYAQYQQRLLRQYPELLHLHLASPYSQASNLPQILTAIQQGRFEADFIAPAPGRQPERLAEHTLAAAHQHIQPRGSAAGPAFEYLLHQPDAAAVFAKLLHPHQIEHSSVYAFAGLYETDRTAYNEAKRRLLAVPMNAFFRQPAMDFADGGSKTIAWPNIFQLIEEGSLKSWLLSPMQTPAAGTRDGAAAVERLLAIQVLWDTPAMYLAAGSTDPTAYPTETYAFDVLSGDEEAGRYWTQVFSRTARAGQLYALAGLYQTDPTAYALYRAALLSAPARERSMTLYARQTERREDAAALLPQIEQGTLYPQLGSHQTRSQQESALLLAQAVLRRAHTVQSRRIGWEARLSQQSLALRVLRQRSDAATQFATLFAQAPNVAGKIYALAGLQETDPAQYQRLKAALDANQKVRVQSADVITEETVSVLLADIERGDLRRFILGNEP